MQPDLHDGFIGLLSTDIDIFSPVKHIDHTLLNPSVCVVVQRIYLKYFIKNRPVIRSDLRYRKGNDRKADL